MSMNCYENFCRAINQKEIKRAEDIFATSDARPRLVFYYISRYEKQKIRDVINSFKSRGLKENAVDICERYKSTYI